MKMPNASTFLLLSLLALAGCSTAEKKPSEEAATGPAKPDAVQQAVLSPFNDLNLVNSKIPDALLSARAAPYALPPVQGCDAIKAEVEALNAALGADLDTPPSAANPGLVERGSSELGDAATGALRGAAEGLVPFRGWVRKLSGAERNSRQFAAAIAAGTIRRAFLKGVGQAHRCPAPASPLPSAKS